MVRGLSILLLFLCGGCAFAPISHLTNARSIGKNNWNFAGGVIGSAGGGLTGGVPVLRAEHGVFDDVDVALQYELVNTGVILKYSVVNQKEKGLSLAFTGGGGSIGNGGYWNVGAITSYRTGFFEPYIAAKFNRMTRDNTQFSIVSLGTFTIPSNTFDFLYFSIGATAWASDRVGIILEYNFFGMLNNSTSFPTSGYLTGAISYKL